MQGLARRVSARRQVSDMAQQAVQNSRIILWFRDDLRLHDNAIVHMAATRIKSHQASEVTPLSWQVTLALDANCCRRKAP